MRFLRSFALSKPPGLAVVLLTVLCAAQSASAALVQYTTVGTFGSTGTNETSIQTGSIVSGVVFGNTADAAIIATGSSSNMTLGAFAVASNSGTAVTLNDTFLLEIFQTSPTGGLGEFTGVLSGTVQFLNSQLVITFNNLSDLVSPVNYELINLGGGSLADNQLGLSFLQPTSLKAEVTVLPLPAAAWAGMALFGVLGGVKLRRSRQLA